MVQNHRPGTTLCLHTFTSDTNMIRVKIWHALQNCIGIAVPAESYLLAGRPLQRAVSTDVPDNMSAKNLFQPTVICLIAVWRRRICAVIQFRGPFSQCPRWLQADENIAVSDARNEQLVPHCHQFAGCLSPSIVQFLQHLFAVCCKPWLPDCGLHHIGCKLQHSRFRCPPQIRC